MVRLSPLLHETRPCALCLPLCCTSLTSPLSFCGCASRGTSRRRSSSRLNSTYASGYASSARGANSLRAHAAKRAYNVGKRKFEESFIRLSCYGRKPREIVRGEGGESCGVVGVEKSRGGKSCQRGCCRLNLHHRNMLQITVEYVIGASHTTISYSKMWHG